MVVYLIVSGEAREVWAKRTVGLSSCQAWEDFERAMQCLCVGRMSRPLLLWRCRLVIWLW